MTDLTLLDLPAAQGLWGLEAIHEWDGAVRLNDLTVTPQFKLDKVTGIHGAADIGDDRAFATARRGEIPLTTFRRGKTVAYEGRVRGRTLAELRAAAALAGGAFDVTDERQMLLTLDPGYGEGSQFYFGRPVLWDCPDVVTTPNDGWFGHQRPFTLAIRLSDPRIYDGAIQLYDTGDPNAGDGAPTPWQTPIRLPNPLDVKGEVEVVNPGTTDADAKVEIYGPIKNPVLANLTTGRELVFNGIEIATGDWLLVDFQTRDVLLNSELPMRSKLDTINSDWWDAGVPCIVPGDNTIRLRGKNMVAPARAVIMFYPAYAG